MGRSHQPKARCEMIEWNSAAPKLDYEVRVGFMRVEVRGVNQAEAIRNARQKLCAELPRMWDVIHALADSRFEVTCRSAN